MVRKLHDRVGVLFVEAVIKIQKRVFVSRLNQFLFHFQGRHLQEANSLLQLRC